MIPVVMLTGVVMAFRLFSPAVVGWAVVLHFAAVGVVVSGLMVHVYMGAVFPEEKPAFFSMITGNVNELFAYSHHFKWWREVKLAERRVGRPARRRGSAGEAERVGGPGGAADRLSRPLEPAARPLPAGTRLRQNAPWTDEGEAFQDQLPGGCRPLLRLRAARIPTATTSGPGGRARRR